MAEDGKSAVVVDGKPVYIHDDGKEVPFDAPAAVSTLSRTLEESKKFKERATAAEAKVTGFEGIDDPDAARKALETVKNLKDGELVTAGKVDEIKAAARKAAEEQVAAAAKASGEKISQLEKERDGFKSDLYGEKIGGAFSRSKFIAEKVAVPADLLQAQFGGRFKVEDGKTVAYDAAGNKIYSRAKPGEIADFDEALETIVDSYAHKDMILKGANHSGSGARPSDGGGAGGGKTMKLAAYNALPPEQQAALMTGKDKPQLVD